MIILTTSTSEQTFRVIPRSSPDEITITLRNDSTNEVDTYVIESLEWDNNNDFWQLADYNWNFTGGFYEENGYLVISNVFALTENRFYDLTIISESSVIYRDKVFCTDQTISDYSVNDGVYTTENTYDNDYIII